MHGLAEGEGLILFRYMGSLPTIEHHAAFGAPESRVRSGWNTWLAADNLAPGGLWCPRVTDP